MPTSSARRITALMFVATCFCGLARAAEIRDGGSHQRRTLLQLDEENHWPKKPPGDPRALVRLFYRVSRQMLADWLRKTGQKIDKDTRVKSKDFFLWAEAKNIKFKDQRKKLTKEELDRIVDDPSRLTKRFMEILVPMLKESFKDTAYVMKRLIRKKSASFIRDLFRWAKMHYANLRDAYLKAKKFVITEYNREYVPGRKRSRSSSKDRYRHKQENRKNKKNMIKKKEEEEEEDEEEEDEHSNDYYA